MTANGRFTLAIFSRTRGLFIATEGFAFYETLPLALALSTRQKALTNVASGTLYAMDIISKAKEGSLAAGITSSEEVETATIKLTAALTKKAIAPCTGAARTETAVTFFQALQEAFFITLKKSLPRATSLGVGFPASVARSKAFLAALAAPDAT